MTPKRYFEINWPLADKTKYRTWRGSLLTIIEYKKEFPPLFTTVQYSPRLGLTSLDRFVSGSGVNKGSEGSDVVAFSSYRGKYF